MSDEQYFIKTKEKVYQITEDETFVGYEAEIEEDPGQPTLIEKSITENGEYLPSDDNADGYNKVTVAVPVPTNKLPQVIARTVTGLTAEDLTGVTEIGSYALAYCKNLRTLEIPDSVEKIGYAGVAYLYNHGLNHVIIGSGIKSIEAYAFTNDTDLIKITILAPIPPVLKNGNAFSGSGITSGWIEVLPDSVDAYKSATNWSQWASRIKAIST